MIFVTGDIHSDPRRLNVDSFYEQKEMTKDDYAIVLGDFGLIWNKNKESKYEKHWLDWLEGKSFTTLFVDGNHENFDRLNSYPVEEWKGGKIQRIRPSVIHLMRGQVFNINGKVIFTFGGAQSTDITDGILEIGDSRIKSWKRDFSKVFRVNHLSWWKEELPTSIEMQEGLDNLNKVNWKVDFVLSHCCASSTQILLSQGWYKPDRLTSYFEDIRAKLEFKKWMFGHYHDNKAINDKEVLIYEQIIRIE